MSTETTKQRLPFEIFAALPAILEAIPDKKKRYVQEPDLSVFTPEQTEGHAKLSEFVRSPGGGMVALQGYAGTGKTFFISRFIEWYLYKHPSPTAITAPTNKAVRKLKDFCEYRHNQLITMTIHSLLGLKEKIEDGRQLFLPDFGVPNKLEVQKLLILDEVSMLSDDLFELIYPYVETGLKVIFVGDPAQIPPVGKDECIPLNYAKAALYGIDHIRFENIIRQATDNPIIAMTMNVRERITERNVITDRTDKYQQNHDGVYYVDADSEEDEKFLEDILKLYFTSKNFEMDADFAKVIAWRNVTVDWANDVIRKMIFGEEVRQLEIGEKLIANKPIFDGDDILFSNNDEMEVKEIQLLTRDFYGQQLNYFQTRVVDVNNSNDVPKWINIICNESMDIYKDVLEEFRKKGVGARKGSFEAKAAWERYFGLQKEFADVKYNYAITAHKSQGSTYENTIVFESDLDMNKNVIERNRIKYTAFSRPRHKLFIVK